MRFGLWVAAAKFLEIFMCLALLSAGRTCLFETLVEAQCSAITDAPEPEIKFERHTLTRFWTPPLCAAPAGLMLPVSSA